MKGYPFGYPFLLLITPEKTFHEFHKFFLILRIIENIDFNHKDLRYLACFINYQDEKIVKKIREIRFLIREIRGKIL